MCVYMAHSHRMHNATHNATQANGTCCRQWECSHCTQVTSKDFCSNFACASRPASCVNEAFLYVQNPRVYTSAKTEQII